MRFLNSVDYAVIALYCGVILAMGLYLWRRASRSLEDYFLGGRNLPWWALGISGMTNFLDMAGTMLIVSFLYMMGPRGLYVEFRGGAVLILAFLMLWTGKWHQRSKCMTEAEWMIYRFGTGAGAQFARISMAIANIVWTVGMLAYLVKGAGVFLSTFLPWPPMTCAILMVAMTTLYTLVSGFYGVVYNDLFQASVILISVVIISVYAAAKVWGYDGDFGALATSVTGTTNWMSSFPHVYAPLPEGYEDYQYLAFLAALYLFRNVVAGVGMGADPRYFGARNERDCGVLTFFWTWLMVFRWPMMMGFAVLGIFLVNELYPERVVVKDTVALIKQHVGEVPPDRWEEKLSDIVWHPERHPELAAALRERLGDQWPIKIQLLGHKGIVNPERVLPAVLLMNVPMGLRGLFICSLVAAAMSTLAPQVNAATAFFTRDIWQAYVRPRSRNRELIAVSYVFGAAMVVAAFFMAYKTAKINEIWDWIIMALAAGMAVPRLLRLYWWRFNGAGVFWSCMTGLVASVAQRWYVTVHPEAEAFWTPAMKFVVITGIAVVGAIIGTYTAPPTDHAVLMRFYRTTRPFGFWARFKETLPPAVQLEMTRETARDVAAVPFALLWQITLFLLPMQVLLATWRDFAVTLVLFGIGLGGLLLIWFRHLPSKEQGNYPSSILMGAEQATAGPAMPAATPEVAAKV